MKTWCLLPVVGSCLAVGVPAPANMLPPRDYPVSRCVKFENLHEFPDIVVIEYVADSRDRHLVKENACVYKGSKLTQYVFLWAKRPHVEAVGLANLPIEQFLKDASDNKLGGTPDEPSLNLLSEDIRPTDSLLRGWGEYQSEELVYRLSRDPHGMIVTLAKKTLKGRRGEDRVETYPPATGSRK